MSSIVAYLGLALSAFLYVPFGDMVMGLVEDAFIDETQSGGHERSMGRLKRWGFKARQGGELDTDRE